MFCCVDRDEMREVSDLIEELRAATEEMQAETDVEERRELWQHNVRLIIKKIEALLPPEIEPAAGSM
jgi:CCR4-NOT transcriptional regulation complex NOT5 subunit